MLTSTQNLAERSSNLLVRYDVLMVIILTGPLLIIKLVWSEMIPIRSTGVQHLSVNVSSAILIVCILRYVQLYISVCILLYITVINLLIKDSTVFRLLFPSYQKITHTIITITFAHSCK